MHDIDQLVVSIVMATLKHSIADLLKLNVSVPYDQ